MESKSVSTNVPSNPRNDTKVTIVRWDVQIPSYLYQEIPATFEASGMILNIIMIIYFIKSGRYRRPLFTILTSLAAAMDTFVCFGGLLQLLKIPKVISPESGYWVAGCKVILFVAATGVVGSEYHLVLFAGLRLYQVMYPLKSRAIVTGSLMAKCCATIAICSSGSSLIYGMFWGPLTRVVDGEVITLCVFNGNAYYKELMYLFIFTIIPCVSIFIIHVLKYFAYLRSKNLVEAQQDRKNPDTRVLVIVITLFYISWIPALVYRVTQQILIKDYLYSRDNLYQIFMHIMFANSNMNPLVYVLAMKPIRDEVINLLCCRRQKVLRKDCDAD